MGETFDLTHLIIDMKLDQLGLAKPVVPGPFYHTTIEYPKHSKAGS